MANPIGNGNPLSPVADYMAPIDPGSGTFGTPGKLHDNPAGGTTAQAIRAFLSGNQANTSEETPDSPQFRYQHLGGAGINGRDFSTPIIDTAAPVLPSLVNGKYTQGSQFANILHYLEQGDDPALTYAIERGRALQASRAQFLSKIDKNALRQHKLKASVFKPGMNPYKWALSILDQLSNLPGGKSLAHFFHELCRRHPLNLDPPAEILLSGESSLKTNITTASTAQLKQMMLLQQSTAQIAESRAQEQADAAARRLLPQQWSIGMPVETLDRVPIPAPPTDEPTFDDLDETQEHVQYDTLWQRTGLVFLRIHDVNANPITIVLLHDDDTTSIHPIDEVRLVEQTDQSSSMNVDNASQLSPQSTPVSSPYAVPSAQLTHLPPDST